MDPIFHHILVPLDGSKIAELALPAATAIAKKSGGALHLATVHSALPVSVVAEAPGLASSIDSELREDARSYLTNAAATASKAGITVDTAVDEADGTVARSLADHIATSGVDLVVMTTHGHGGMSRLWLGSVADRLLRQVMVPVLLARPADGPLRSSFPRILVALDGSDEGHQVWQTAIRFGSVVDASEYLLVEVVEPSTPVVEGIAIEPRWVRPEPPVDVEAIADGYLETVAEQFHRRGLTATTTVITGRGIGRSLVDYARQVRADLIVIGTRGARGLERLILGSVADKVIRSAPRPVLVVPTARSVV